MWVLARELTVQEKEEATWNGKPRNESKGFPVQFPHTINKKPDPKTLHKWPRSALFI